MGYLSVKALKDVLDKKTIEKEVDTGSVYVNLANFDNPETQKLVYPEKNQ